MSLEMVFVESSALDLDQQVARECVTEQNVGTPSVYDDLSPNELEPRLYEQVWAVCNRFLHVTFKHDQPISGALEFEPTLSE
jgi:hypothetical protein